MCELPFDWITTGPCWRLTGYDSCWVARREHRLRRPRHTLELPSGTIPLRDSRKSFLEGVGAGVGEEFSDLDIP